MPLKINVESHSSLPSINTHGEEGVSFSLELGHSYGQMNGQIMCHDKK